MIDEMGRWSDGNGTDTFYPAAAIVGHDPADILTQLEAWIRNNTYPNLHIHTGGGGIENLNTVPATIDEMLLQSFQGKIRPFANWPTGTSARFGDLRAFGAFLVSGDIRANAVQYLRVISERGRPVTIVNPWPTGTMLRLYRNGKDAGPLTGAELTLPTSPGEVLHIAPDGTSYDSILSKMRTPL
jgi:alpha-L-fucosidase 2